MKIYENFNLLATHSHISTVYSCFLHNYENAICVDAAGYTKKYNFQTQQQSDFYYTGNDGLYSGIQIMDKLVILGKLSGGKIYILDEYGNHINSHQYSSSSTVSEIAEVRRNILLTVDKYSVYLHDIYNPYNIPPSVQLLTGDRYSSIVSLKSNEGDFAIGGKRINGGKFKGYVDIYHLVIYSAHRIKTKGAIEGEDCAISALVELRTRVIVFGCDSDCNVICLWNYAVWPEQEPECWDDQTTYGIYDFIALG